jgi:hypothetical protein
MFNTLVPIVVITNHPSVQMCFVERETTKEFLAHGNSKQLMFHTCINKDI